jgi:hypothetical protein
MRDPGRDLAAVFRSFPMKDGPAQRIAVLLRETGQAHHRAFADVNGEDPEWPRWYAERLVEPLGRELGTNLDATTLARDLADAEAERQARTPDAEWPGAYATWLLGRYGRPT